MDRLSSPELEKEHIKEEILTEEEFLDWIADKDRDIDLEKLGCLNDNRGLIYIPKRANNMVFLCSKYP